MDSDSLAILWLTSLHVMRYPNTEEGREAFKLAQLQARKNVTPFVTLRWKGDTRRPHFRVMQANYMKKI